MDILDAGCGEGDQICKLLQAGARHVTGLDCSQRMLQLASERPELKRDAARAKLVGCSIESFVPESPAIFQLIISSLMFHYVDNLDQLAARLIGLVTPGGHLVFSVEHPINTSLIGVAGLKNHRDRIADALPIHYPQPGRRQGRFMGIGMSFMLLAFLLRCA
jgi:predicted TPR repeat methyltransferase